MKRYKTPDEFYSDERPYLDILQRLRNVLSTVPELKETIKWGAASYTYNKKILIGVGSFKSYAGLWFHQGGLLKDPAKVLINAQEGKTQALRQWRFQDVSEVDDKLLLEYIAESIENCKAGKEIKPKKKPLLIPEELKKAFETHTGLQAAFEKLNLTRQREHAEHIAGAKREETRLSRLEKCIPIILDGKGLYDKYKNC